MCKRAEPPARSRPLPPAPAGRPVTWFLWIDQTRPGFLNMAIDHTLLQLAAADGVGFLRLYGWAPPCLSFGRHEPALRRYSRARIESRRIDTVRRPTGGRAVWHHIELTYAVAAGIETFGPLHETHRAIHRTLCDALTGLGLPATLAVGGRPARVDTGACFSSPTGGEVMVEGRKVIGSAQVRTRTAFLQHGSVLLGGDQRLVEEVAEGPAPEGPAPEGADAALDQLLGRRVGFDEMAERLAVAARDWAGEWRPVLRGDAILERSAGLADAYRSDRWTWSR